jgi:hypothetical protein
MGGQDEAGDQGPEHTEAAVQENSVGLTGRFRGRDADPDRPARYLGFAEPCKYRRTVEPNCLNQVRRRQRLRRLHVRYLADQFRSAGVGDDDFRTVNNGRDPARWQPLAAQ